MSNVVSVRNACDAFAKGDVLTVLRFLAPEIKLQDAKALRFVAVRGHGAGIVSGCRKLITSPGT